MRLEQIIALLESLAPLTLAEPWDAVGLHLGDRQRPVKRALLCIDLTPAVLAEAITQKASLIVAYHPPIFEPIQRLTADDAKGRILLDAAAHHLSIYSPHTALDAAAGGVCDFLAQAFDAVEAAPILPRQATRAADDEETEVEPGRYKVVAFVPPMELRQVRTAMARAGAGHIGDYAVCSFGLWGHGTFLGGKSTRPAIGRRGKLEHVDEIRLEMVCPADALREVIQALIEAHPYEEPAFDIYKLEPTPGAPVTPRAQTGAGRVVTLRRPTKLDTLCQAVREHLGVKTLDLAAPTPPRAVRKLALCPGAGGSLLKDAGPIDLFFTGEMRHHDVLAAVSRGTAVLLAGHSETERPYLRTYRKKLAALTGDAVSWLVSKADHAPLRRG
jgi:dinuclear metal center YbgI/SA1388 family protein